MSYIKKHAYWIWLNGGLSGKGASVETPNSKTILEMRSGSKQDISAPPFPFWRHHRWKIGIDLSSL